ncbi:ECF-type sigma factor [Singulisphaera sp. Ch08]|uniref:ECF-type sigma factor n=1 Tax=Singulisphaera sp. Ch08 TaxID=3120278 RepID=A0AAU7CS38_9BACT
MSDGNFLFPDLIRRVRLGDADAAEELIRRYEPEIRLKVRTWLRLRNPELRRAFDSMDICQSVMAHFFVRVTAGQYDLDEPSQLLGLLTVMARNKLSEQVRYQQSQRRDLRRTHSMGTEALTAANRETPSSLASAKELLAAFRSRLSIDELELADMRARGREWASIAEELGGTPDGRRKQWSRSIDRVARELGLVEGGDVPL